MTFTMFIPSKFFYLKVKRFVILDSLVINESLGSVNTGHLIINDNIKSEMMKLVYFLYLSTIWSDIY